MRSKTPPTTTATSVASRPIERGASGCHAMRAVPVESSIAAVCAAAGGSLADVVKLNVYLTDLSNFAKLNEIMAKYFTEPYPARAAVGVASLPRGAQVEIEAKYAGYLQRQLDQGLVEVPVPTRTGLCRARAGLLDQVGRITRPFTARTFDIGLAPDIELLHRDRRAPAGRKGTAQQIQAQAMVRGVIVDLAQQHDAVTAQAPFPGIG